MGHAFHLDLRHLHRRKEQSRTQTDVCAIRNSGIETTRSAPTIRGTRIVHVLLVVEIIFTNENVVFYFQHMYIELVYFRNWLSRELEMICETSSRIFSPTFDNFL